MVISKEKSLKTTISYIRYDYVMNKIYNIESLNIKI